VNSADLSLKKLVDFFLNNKIVNKNGVRYAGVSPFDTNYYKKISINKKKRQKEYEEVFQNIINKINNKKELAPIEDFIYHNFSFFLGDLKKTHGK